MGYRDDEAALCRERADWLVGINATRLFSCLYGQTLNVGRVMTPTLAMVAARDAAIRGFTPEPFYTVELDIGGFRLKSGRIKDREEAAQLLRACRSAGRAVITKTEQQAKYDRPPLLYDLTSLQRDEDTAFELFASMRELDRLGLTQDIDHYEVVYILANLVTNIGTFVASPLILFVLGCGIYCAAVGAGCPVDTR